MKRGFLNTAAIVTIVTGLLGCDLAPDYEKPSVPEPAAFKENAQWSLAEPQDGIPKGTWWKAFHDPQLDVLEDGVTTANQNLKIALAQYEGALAAAQAARSAYFPSVTGNASGVRERESTALADKPLNSTFYNFAFGANLSYEVDLWGRVRNAVAAGEDQAQASAADLAGVQLSLHAEMAQDYFSLRGDDEAQATLDETVVDFQKAADLTKNRFQGGVAAEADYDQAETQLENAKTQAADMRLQRSQLEHAIALLIGKAPADFALPPAPISATLLVPNPGLPSVLLERRPDIGAAERRVASANAEIGVARAAWFPTFNLTGTFGYETSPIQNWLTSPANYWSLGPSAVLTLFDGGYIDALNDQAKAAYNEAVASYRQTVLVAYQEVEDNLAALHHLHDENLTQNAAKKAADRALAQANSRYLGGATNYLDVITAQNYDLQAKLGVVNIVTRQLTASTLLIRALGGGWTPEDMSLDKTPQQVAAPYASSQNKPAADTP